MNKITVEMRNEHGQRFASDHAVDDRVAEFMRDPTAIVTIRVGFESVMLPKADLAKLFNAVEIAAMTGASYPEDWAKFYGLTKQEPNQ